MRHLQKIPILYTIDDLEYELLEVNGVEKLEPVRNEEYEKSFFDGEDLLEYLNSEEE